MADKNSAGILIAALNEIANACRDGGYVSIIGDKLYYNYRSARGHQVNHAQYIVQAGKLHKMTVGHYPGQTYFPDLEFMRQVNERFTFRG